MRAPLLSALRGPSLVAPVALAGAAVIALQGESPPALETALVIAFLVLSLALHEVAHGWVALRCGDTTARDLGRLSLNPLVHIDPVWTVLVPLVTFLTSGFIFGGAKPVPVNFMRLRSPLRDMSLVAVAGPLTNLALAVVFLLAWKLATYSGPYQFDQLLPRVLLHSARFNVVLFVFNLIPIPPLDGSRILTWLLPSALRPAYQGLERIGMLLIVLLLFFVPGFSAWFGRAIDDTITVLDRITGGIW